MIENGNEMMHSLSENRTETEKCAEEQAQRVTGIARTEKAEPSQRVKDTAGNAMLGKHLALAKASRLPLSIRKKVFSRWVPKPNLLEGSGDTTAELNDPIHGDENIADPTMLTGGVEQLVDQWLANGKDLTLPGTEVNKIREDFKVNSETDSRDKRLAGTLNHKPIGKRLLVPTPAGNIFSCPKNAASANSATFASGAECNQECINSVQKTGNEAVSPRTGR